MSFSAKRLLINVASKFFDSDRNEDEVFVVLYHRNLDGDVMHKSFYPISGIHSTIQHSICIEAGDRISHEI